jgi:polyvinyl alcohol dehydrogenase (cytochrome)
MSARRPFTGREHGGSRPERDDKEGRRGLFVALMGAGTGFGMVVLAFVLAMQSWSPFGPLLGSVAPAGAPARAQSAPPVATATDVPTPPPIAFVNSSLTWPTYMGTSARSGDAGSETALTATTVAQLKLHWQLQAGGGIFSQPVVANGLIYWGSWDGYEHATSVATGKDVWARYLGQTSNVPCEGFVAGVSSTATVEFAPVEGRRTLLIFVGGGNAIFYALNAATGAIVWQTPLAQPPDAYLWSSPAYDTGSIYMGIASLGDCPLVQGQVVKLSAASGKVEAIFDAVPTGCTGASVWGSVAIDSAAGMLYFGTGNPGDCGVDEPYAEAVVALRTSDLGLVGAWQSASALQYGDSDFGSTPTLFTATVGGATRQMVGVANKNGLYYAFDAAHVGNGPVWTTQVSDVAMCPACGDGGFAPGAWDGKLLYEPGGKTTINGAPCPGGLRALDPANGAVVWSACYPGPTYAALTLGPGFLVIGASPALLVVGTQGASAGRVLYSFADPQAPNTWFFGAPSVADGVLYVGDADGNFYALGL